MKYLVLLYRSEDAMECEFYWTDDYADAVSMAENEEYHNASLVTVSDVAHYERE